MGVKSDPLYAGLVGILIQKTHVHDLEWGREILALRLTGWKEGGMALLESLDGGGQREINVVNANAI